MPTPSIQTLRADAQQVLNLDSISAVRSVVAATLANANAGTPLNPNLTTQQLWNEFYQIVTQPKSDIESIIANQLMKFLYAPPAPGGAGADKQVIFNDGGVLAGDPGLTFDKVTNALTITGDLTVRTNRLVATTTGVGIGTTTLFGDLNIQNGSNCRLEVTSQAGGTTIENLNNARNAYLNMTMFADAYIWNRLGSEAMRLNSTGLGVGVTSPATKLDVNGGTGGIGGQNHATFSGNAGRGLVIGTRSDNVSADRTATLNAPFTGGGIVLQTQGTDRLTLDSSGNVGIGVAPSAWNSAVPALQVKGVSGVYGAGSSEFGSVQNCFYNASAAWIYGTTAAAGRYAISSGTHQWHIAPSGTAGNAITFTQAMTLDASGRLIVNSSTFVPPTLNTNGELNFLATSNTNVRFSYRGTDGVTRVANITLA